MKSLKKYIIKDIPWSLLIISAYFISIFLAIQTKTPGGVYIPILLPIIFFFIFYIIDHKKNTLAKSLLIYIRALLLSFVIAIFLTFIYALYSSSYTATDFFIFILLLFLFVTPPCLLYLKLSDYSQKIEDGIKTPFIFIFCIISLIIITLINYEIISIIASLIGVEVSTGGPTPPFD